MKRAAPDSLIFTHRSGGDFASIGLGESIFAANRGLNPLGGVTDDLIAMDGPSLKKLPCILRPGGTMLINSSIVDEKGVDRKRPRPLSPRGGARVISVIMLSA